MIGWCLFVRMVSSSLPTYSQIMTILSMSASEVECGTLARDCKLLMMQERDFWSIRVVVFLPSLRKKTDICQHQIFLPSFSYTWRARASWAIPTHSVSPHNGPQKIKNKEEKNGPSMQSNAVPVSFGLREGSSNARGTLSGDTFARLDWLGY